MENSEEEPFTSANEALRKSEIEVIFNQYLSKKSLAEEQSRLLALQFGIPPEHDDSIVKEEKKTSTKVQVYTKHRHNDTEARYDLLLEDEAWRIDAKAFNFENWKTRRNVF